MKFDQALVLVSKTDLNAEAVSNLLVEQTTVGMARKIIADAFKEDPHFRESYVANAAVRMVDEGVPSGMAQIAAELIVKAFFEDE